MAASSHRNFRSDNVTGVMPEIMAAIQAANSGAAAAYGNDEATRRVERRLAELFETELTAFPVATGTASNALALATMTPGFGAVICHELAHINVDECGAPELYTGGAKLIDLPGAHGKIDADAVARELAKGNQGVVHSVQPHAVSITQATERGTIYSVAETEAIAEAAHRHGLRLHMDGTRFANAIAALGCSPAEASWRAGVDVLSLGASKNGAMAAEAVVFFDRGLARDFGYLRKRGGHLFSKMRFVSAQLEAYLSDDLWLRAARHANEMSRRLRQGMAEVPGARILDPAGANLFYVSLPEPVIAALEADGFGFYREGGPETIRLVTAWDSDPREVAAFIAAARTHAAALGKFPHPRIKSGAGSVPLPAARGEGTP
jgi:threonine aldolase